MPNDLDSPGGPDRLTRREALRIATVAATGVTMVGATGSARAWARPARTSLTVADWEKRFRHVWERDHETFLALSRSGDGWHLYNLGYGIDACVAMVEATGKREYLDRALLYVENAMDTARPSSSFPHSDYQDDYLGWVWSAEVGPSADGEELPLSESYGWRYVTRMLRVIRNTPCLYRDPVYQRRYDSILAFTEKHIFDKWYDRGTGNLYRSRTHMASHWEYIAINLGPLTTDARRRARCAAVADKIDRDLRGQLREHPDNSAAYFWSAVWGSSAPPGQDVSHGNNMLSYIVEAHDLAPERWTRADIAAFAATLKTVIWRDSDHAEYVDGSGDGAGWFNDGFCKLGRYDPEIQTRLESHDVGRNMQLYGNCTLNAKRLEVTRAAG